MVMQYARKFYGVIKVRSRFYGDRKAENEKVCRRFSLLYSESMAGQLIQTYQELYERAIEVERVKGELRALNPGNQKRK